ncbi:hypothetical protein [Myxococcus sp. RHSTA-1-4]|uniref:hypothetical protein n=1 Tax=Myxococcus sp. RHSTA-1-4 TaxID=2874601 RepID=UPI001CBB4EA0|nr:hypothetical protein [Myxococcus sp. RHSTA-1-4]MBZ4422947.1 hypothetical protein [Myxococcus sp. RHSTA-1-4]
MMRRIALGLVSFALCSPVWAQEQEQEKQQEKQVSPSATGGSGAPMDMSKMGPWTRKPTNESKTRKEVEAFIKEEDAIMKRRDFQASLERVDFPIFMATDNSKGIPSAESYERQKYSEMMKPFFDQMPADMQVNHKLDITVLSDSMVSYTDTYTATMEGKKRNGRSAGLLVKREGQWKWKAFFEPGWGDEQPAGVGGAGQPQGEEKPKQ